MGSSQQTEAEEGAWWHTVAPGNAAGTENGLTSNPTYFYPGVLLQVARGENVDQKAWHIASQPYDKLLAGLRFALGIGALPAKVTTRSKAIDHWRGRIVPLRKATAEMTRAKVGVIITEPKYSITRCYQLILPLLDGSQIVADRMPAHSVVLSSPAWAGLVDANATSVLTAPQLLVSLRHNKHVDELSLDVTAIATAAELSAIDEALVSWFKLPAYGAKQKEKPSEMNEKERIARLRHFMRGAGSR